MPRLIVTSNCSTRHAVSQQDYDNALANFQGYEADVFFPARRGRANSSDQSRFPRACHVTHFWPYRYIASDGRGVCSKRPPRTCLLPCKRWIRCMWTSPNQRARFSDLRRDLESGRLKSAGSGEARVLLTMEDGNIYGQEGTLQLSDVTVNLMTSTVTVRAILPNPKNELLPGMFVRARLEQGVNPNAILVPQLAVTRNQKGEPTAMVVNAENKAELRILKTERAVQNQWLVSDGLKPGDKLIVDSLQRVHPGDSVKPVPAKIAPEFLAAVSHD